VTRQAKKSLVERLDGAGIPTPAKSMVQAYSKRSAVEWCHDLDAPFEIEARLERNGFDQATINAKVFLQARGSFAANLAHGVEEQQITEIKYK
jgi:hypothetical protein